MRLYICMTSINNTEHSINKLNISYFKKVISPSADELKKHNEYLKKNLKKNYFN